VVAPILAASGKKFDIAMCPERTLEGKALQELRELPQIVGADDPAVADRAAAIFRRLTISIVQVADIETAEIIKLVSNTFRDVQFAFANEVARVCDAFGVSAHEVISAGKLGYNRTNIPLPGLVGGPCLEKDPHILMESARTRGIEMEITSAGRLVNERQPEETVQFISSEINRRKLASGPLKISILGMAFKGLPETSDLRGGTGRGVSGRGSLQQVRRRGQRCIGGGDREQPSLAWHDWSAHHQRVHQPGGVRVRLLEPLQSPAGLGTRRFVLRCRPQRMGARQWVSA
jgi:UDP-N-acetyl-D-mannosaminuronic acid dehydrogenase